MNFRKQIGLVSFFMLVSISLFKASAQQGDYYTGEIGIGLGAAHYFGDLNSTTQLNRPKPAATLFYRKNWGQYIATRVGVSFAQIGYADRYNTHNEIQLKRNLSFNSNVWELSLQGDFNFFRFVPHEPGFNFTPYITLGAGLINYDPYTYLNNERIYFRQLPIGTEGQNSPLYPERKMYSNNALSIPFGGGFKYSIGGGRLNLTLEVLHRYTSTDYLDDVSTTYVDPAAFPKPPGGVSVAQLLSDRSGEIGTPIGIPGRQRGNGSRQKDQFVTAVLMVSFNLMSYKCPSAD
ncbi:MAG TPA: hypothetical protein DCP55_02015 [Chitinophagaceae bacterium]|nr:hypothetical protein [Chitinophagaceae bacterium]HAL94755.1 hypothetical protein [Chitinophagaceae bacterium]